MTLPVLDMPKKLFDYPLFDADTHWTEPADLWTSRAPAKFRDQVMHVRRSPSGVDAWHVGGKNVASLGPSVVKTDLSKASGTFSLPNRDDMSDCSTHVVDRLAVMDSLGVGSQIVYPNAIGFASSTLLRMSGDPELRLFHIQAYNDALADMQRESGNRLLGQMVLPYWDLELAIAEMERGRRLGITGVSMNVHTSDWNQPSLVDPKWYPFFAAAEALELPLNFHVASGDWASSLDSVTYWGDRRMFLDDAQVAINSRFSLFQTVMVQTENQSTILNLLVSGLLDRFPKLKFVSVESGASWTPFLLDSLDYQLVEMTDRETRNSFKRPFRQAFAEQIFLSYWFEGKLAIDYYVASVGADNLLFQTDFPHPICLFPQVQEHAAASTAGLSEADRRKILFGNAEKVYGVKVGEVTG